MKNVTRILIGVVAGMMISGGAYVAAAGSDDDGMTTTVGTTTTETTTTTGTTTGDDVSGPCDEAEHAKDPRCNGPQRPEDDPAGEDGRHNRGPGSLNSGPGNARDRGEDRVDNSGPGNAEDRGEDDDDDHSGSGSGDDSSGHSGRG